MVSKLPFEGRLKLTVTVGLRLIQNTLDELSLVSCGRNKRAKIFPILLVQRANEHGFLLDVFLM